MRPALRKRLRILAFAAGLALAGCGGKAAPSPKRTTIGLYSSLPIAWTEGADVRDLIAGKQPGSWVLPTLRDRGRVVLLDTLATDQGALPLPMTALLVLAQPRALTARENVALDAWVQAGGHVLMFADPMLTAPSSFALGDPRRPQDTALLSPILARWGLRLEFDEGQPVAERSVPSSWGDVPVNLAGRFRLLGKAGDAVAKCRLEADGLIAQCSAGRGGVIAIADAALLENQGNSADIPAREGVLDRLLGWHVDHDPG